MPASAAAAGAGQDVLLLLSVLRTGLAAPPSRRPLADYALLQRAPQMPRWRRQIVEWSLQVSLEFRLGADTVALAVNFFDRLLSSVVVPPEELQKASLACLLVASKLLDREPLSLRHVERFFCEIATRDEVCMAELNILHYLRWDMNAFTALDFVRTALQLVPEPALKACILARAEKAHEAALLDYGMLRFHPCAVGFACIDVACEANGFDVAPLREGLALRGVYLDSSAEVVACLKLLLGSQPPSCAASPSASQPPASPASTLGGDAHAPLRHPASPAGSVGSSSASSGASMLSLAAATAAAEALSPLAATAAAAVAATAAAVAAAPSAAAPATAGGLIPPAALRPPPVHTGAARSSAAGAAASMPCDDDDGGSAAAAAVDEADEERQLLLQLRRGGGGGGFARRLLDDEGGAATVDMLADISSSSSSSASSDGSASRHAAATVAAASAADGSCSQDSSASAAAGFAASSSSSLASTASTAVLQPGAAAAAAASLRWQQQQHEQHFGGGGLASVLGGGGDDDDDDDDPFRSAAASCLVGELLPGPDDLDSWVLLADSTSRGSATAMPGGGVAFPAAVTPAPLASSSAAAAGGLALPPPPRRGGSSASRAGVADTPLLPDSAEVAAASFRFAFAAGGRG